MRGEMTPPDGRWETLSLDDLNELISRGLADADDAVVAAWERIHIPPEKWQCRPWGDAGGGFWAVATIGDSVVWYNDIEEGFNVSTYSSRGIIDEYWCNQTTFEEFLLGLPEAIAAEAFAGVHPSALVPDELRGPGEVLRRQTTFWVVRTSAGACWRVHFSGKRETSFAGAHYGSLQLLDRHPVLTDFAEPWADLYLAGSVSDPAKAIRRMEGRVAAASGGWRRLQHYQPDTLVMEKVLKAGYGLLLRAPRRVVDAAEAAVLNDEVSVSVLDGRAAEGAFRVLLLGSATFIVAKAFRFEPQAEGVGRD
jgi:hypothetical protein